MRGECFKTVFLVDEWVKNNFEVLMFQKEESKRNIGVYFLRNNMYNLVLWFKDYRTKSNKKNRYVF